MRNARRGLRPDPFRVWLSCERLEERETPSAGALDPTFGAGGHLSDARVQGNLRAVAIQADGKIVAAGITKTSTGTDAVIVRYNADGTPDKTFDGDGVVTLDFGKHHSEADAIAIQSDGKIVIAGDDGGDGLHLARLNTNGTLDKSFDGGGQAFTAFAGMGVTAQGVAIEANGKIVVVGTGSTGRAVLARFNNNGILDRSFDGTGQAVSTALSSGDAVAVQPDGKVVVAGAAVSWTTAAIALVRFTSAGLLDTTFGSAGSARTAFRYASSLHAALALQLNGQIVVAGGADVLRYNSTGSLDTHFGTGGDANTTLTGVAGVAVATDGTIYVSGNSSVGANAPNTALVHLTSAGLLDKSFDGDGRVTADLGGRDGATALALTAGKAVLTASATGSAGTPVGTVARFLTAAATTSTSTRTTTTLSVSKTTLAAGQSITITVIVSPASGSAVPTGMVTLKNDGVMLANFALSNGRISIPTGGLLAGTYTLAAVYNGASGFTGSTATAVTVRVTAATTTKSTTTALSTSANPRAGQPVTLTAAVSVIGGGTASGTVTFKDGTKVLGTASVSSGRALFSTSGLAAGTHQLTAVYGGVSGITGSTSATAGITVAPAVGTTKSTTTALSVSASPKAGQPVTLTASVSIVGGGTASGTVTFRDGTKVLGTASVSGGRAVFSTSGLAAGTHQLTAVYGGVSGISGSTSAVRALAVAPAVGATKGTITALSSSASPRAGQPVSLTATVAVSGGGTASGTVTFKDGTKVLGTASVSGGRAVFSTSALAAGSHSLTAVYGGASGLTGSTSAALALAVAPAVGATSTTTALAISAGAAFYGQPVTLTATVRGGTAPTGTVTFKDGSVTVGTVALTNGSATLTLSTLPVGKDSLTAVYNGDGRSAASSSSARAITVNQAQASVSFVLSPSTVKVGTTMTFRATVKAMSPSGAVPTGQVTFRADDTTLGTVTLDKTGTAILTIPIRLTVAQHWITVGYFGTASFGPDASGDLLTVVA